MKLTRRKLVGAVIAGTALAQTQPAQSPPANADEESKFVAAEAQRRAQVLAEFSVPMAVEPAFEFKA
jgi:hypothetical protein